MSDRRTYLAPSMQAVLLAAQNGALRVKITDMLTAKQWFVQVQEAIASHTIPDRLNVLWAVADGGVCQFRGSLYRDGGLWVAELTITPLSGQTTAA